MFYSTAVALIFIRFAESLKCFVTDLPPVTAATPDEVLLNAKPAIRDCRLSSYDDDTRCATVTMEIDEGSVNLQMCIRSYVRCSNIKKQLKFLASMDSLDLNKIKCEICGSDYCNSGVERFVVLKEGSSDVSKVVRVGLPVLIVAVGVGVVAFKKYKKKQQRPEHI